MWNIMEKKCTEPYPKVPIQNARNASEKKESKYSSENIKDLRGIAPKFFKMIFVQYV
jgi:hypothetical protein